MEKFNARNFHAICDALSARDEDLALIISHYGYPPLWSRPNTFESLVHIILEQQVSLASALAALKKLQEKTQGITPERILLLSDAELRACYVSRQKSVYIRNLAVEISEKRLHLKKLALLPDEQVRATLIRLKGIGHWTADIYLIFVLQRPDVFPLGDLAALSALKRIKKVADGHPVEALKALTDEWRPYRSVAAMMLWHHYLSLPRPGKSVIS